MLTKLAIIIINYNLRDDTEQCINSLLKAGATLEQLVVVDNASQDGSIAFLRQRFGDRLEIIAAEQNLGYPHGLNLGIQPALDKGANWILFLNNDTIVDEHFLTELENAACQENGYALLGPLILYHNAPNRIWFLGSRRLAGTLITSLPYFNKEVPPHLPPVMPFDFIHGCCMLVKGEVFETIGLFDDSSLIYGDDVDFCWRAHLAGFRMATVTRARMWHKVSSTMKRRSPRTLYLRIRNQARFYRRYARGFQFILMICFTLLRTTFLALGNLLRGQPELMKPLVEGWWDGWVDTHAVDRY